MLAGAGIGGGAAGKVMVADLHATILHALGIDHEYEFMTSVNRPIAFSEGRVIPELLADS